MRILAVTSEARLPQAPDISTVKEAGYDMTFANWRGFFGAPGLPKEKAEAFRGVLEKMYSKPEWAKLRDQRAWQDLYKPGTEFTAFLEKMENHIGGMMRKLGFIQ